MQGLVLMTMMTTSLNLRDARIDEKYSMQTYVCLSPAYQVLSIAFCLPTESTALSFVERHRDLVLSFLEW